MFKKIWIFLSLGLLVAALAWGQSSTKDLRSQILVQSEVMPAGVIMSYAGSSAPTGWLFAYGQTLNAVTNPQYQPLFNAIGNTYGGTNNTNFVVPDLRGRVAAGKDNMGGVAANRLTSGVSGITGTTLGAAGGDQNMMQHSHSIHHDHPAVNTGSGTNTTALAVVDLSNAPGNGANSWTSHTPGRNNTLAGGTSTQVPGLSHIHSVNIPNFTGTSGNAGTGTTQGNVQPTIVLNFIIKY